MVQQQQQQQQARDLGKETARSNGMVGLSSTTAVAAA
jgi:hypothetical protein